MQPGCQGTWEEREGLILAWERRLEILAHDVQRTGVTGRRVRLLDLVASAIDTMDNNKDVVWPRYPSNSSSSLSDSYGSCSKYSSKNDGRKVAYHGMPCLWEHENTLQRSQDSNKNKRCEDRRKHRWKTVVEKPPLRVSQICAYARSIEAVCHKYVPKPVIGLIQIQIRIILIHVNVAIEFLE